MEEPIPFTRDVWGLGTFIFFILVIVLLVTLLFWVPFLLLYSLDALDCENVDSTLDTLALAFSTLLNVQSQYAPKSGLVVIAISIDLCLVG